MSFTLKVGKLIDSDIMQLLPLGFGKLVATLLGGNGEDEAAAVTEMVRPIETHNSAYPTTLQQLYEQSAPTQGVQRPALEPQYGQPMTPPQQQDRCASNRPYMYNKRSLQVLTARL